MEVSQWKLLWKSKELLSVVGVVSNILLFVPSAVFCFVLDRNDDLMNSQQLWLPLQDQTRQYLRNH